MHNTPVLLYICHTVPPLRREWWIVRLCISTYTKSPSPSPRLLGLTQVSLLDILCIRRRFFCSWSYKSAINRLRERARLLGIYNIHVTWHRDQSRTLCNELLKGVFAVLQNVIRWEIHLIPTAWILRKGPFYWSLVPILHCRPDFAWLYQVA